MSIEQGSFAEACFDSNSAEELVAALNKGPDHQDMNDWGLSESEWKAQVELALKEMQN